MYVKIHMYVIIRMYVTIHMYVCMITTSSFRDGKNIKYHYICAVVGLCVPLCNHTVHIIHLYFVSITLLKIATCNMWL